MRLYSFILLLFVTQLMFSQKGLNYTPSDERPAFGMTFDQRHVDLGKVKRGEKRSTEFTFTNTGKEDIEIELVSACECTTLDWPSHAIKPGEKGTIKAVFDSTEKEESEKIEIDINLKNREADTGYKRLEIVSYYFELIP